jgi:hypothetical protein
MDFEFYTSLFNSYDQYREKSLNHLQVRFADIQPLMNKLNLRKEISILSIGLSVEDREISVIRLGQGQTHVLLWSQMHGNETTATKAIFDVLNYLFSDRHDSSFVRTILETLTLHFVPMVNPDGSEQFTRTNALDIDINRDARTLTAPESKALYEYFVKIKPAFCFNLHDQHDYFGVQNGPEPSTISFMAPAFDESCSINENRKKAMQIIVELSGILKIFIPGKISLYEDSYEPRAFGDVFQKMGVLTILIESGGYPHDKERFFCRKLNYMLLLSSFEIIVADTYKKANIQKYYALPEGTENLFDLIIRDVSLEKNNKKYATDIGIRCKYMTEKYISGIFPEYYIDFIGDLSHDFAYTEFSANGLQAIPGKTLPNIIQNRKQLSELDVKKLIIFGYTTIRTLFKPDNKLRITYPLNIRYFQTRTDNGTQLQKPANFLLLREKKPEFVCINGRLLNIDNLDILMLEEDGERRKEKDGIPRKLKGES